MRQLPRKEGVVAASGSGRGKGGVGRRFFSSLSVFLPFPWPRLVPPSSPLGNECCCHQRVYLFKSMFMTALTTVDLTTTTAAVVMHRSPISYSRGTSFHENDFNKFLSLPQSPQALVSLSLLVPAFQRPSLSALTLADILCSSCHQYPPPSLSAFCFPPLSIPNAPYWRPVHPVSILDHCPDR